jgi:hypothetical protein
VWIALDGPGQSESKSSPCACPDTLARWKATGPGWQSRVINIKSNRLAIRPMAGTAPLAATRDRPLTGIRKRLNQLFGPSMAREILRGVPYSRRVRSHARPPNAYPR